MSDLTARLLAEIERRTKITYSVPRNIVAKNQILALMQGNLTYLAALRKIVEIHTAKEVRVYGVGVESAIGWRTPTGPYAIELDCTACDGCLEWPCPTITAIAEALDVTP